MRLVQRERRRTTIRPRSCPPRAPVYVEAVLHPDGKVRSDVEGALKKILRTDDPDAKILGLLEQAGDNKDVTFKDDVEPWLGDRLGVAVTALHQGRDADFAVIVASTDDDKAQALLDKQKGDIVKRSYKDVDYRFDRKEGTATAIIDHRVVVANEGGLKAVVDAKGKEHLDESNGLEAVRSKVAAGPHRALLPRRPGAPAHRRAAGQQRPAGRGHAGVVLERRAQDDRRRPAGRSPTRCASTRSAIGTPKSATTGGSAADIVATLPGDSWLGFGVANLGQTLDRVLQTVAGSGGFTGVGVNALLGQFKKQTSLDLRKDVLGWMGDAGVFVGGTSGRRPRRRARHQDDRPRQDQAHDGRARALRAPERRHEDHRAARQRASTTGFTVKSNGPARSCRSPSPATASSWRSAGATSWPRPSPPASSSARRRPSPPPRASSATACKPSFYLDFAQVTKLIEAFAGTDADFQKAKPYLDTFGAIVAGAKDEGSGVTRVALRRDAALI